MLLVRFIVIRHMQCKYPVTKLIQEILMISDRIIVMDNGRIAGELSRKDATIDSLGMLMGGITQEANA